MRKVTACFYAFSFFDDFILIYPLYAVMFADNGLSAYKISSLLIAWSLTAFLLEVPSGSIADKYSRRQVLIAGILLRAIGYSFWLFQRNYPGFLIGFILWGVKSALTSGTEEALVYDELKQADELPSYAKVTGRMQTLSLIAIALASFAASGLAHHGYSLILVLSIISVLVAGSAIYLLPRTDPAKSVEGTRYLEYLKEGIKQVGQSPKVIFIIAFMSIVAGLGAVDEYFGLFFRDKGFTNTGIAFWTGIITLMGALGGFFAHRLVNKRFRAEASLILWAGLLFATAISPKAVAPFLLGFYFMFLVAVQVLFNAHLQKEIADKTRATVTSVGGFTSELFALAAFGVVSVGANHINYAYGYKLISGVVILSALLLLLYNRRAKVVI